MIIKNPGYNIGYSLFEDIQMAKNKELPPFGEQLRKLRMQKGFTQQELADEINTSRRVIIYYERETNHPPSNLLPDMAKALNVSIDELLGIKPTKKKAPPNIVASPRLSRRIQQIEKLDNKNKRQLLQIIDTFIEREKLQKAADLRR